MFQRALGVEFGALSRLSDFDLADPVVRAKLRERYGARVPLDEPVIAPAAIAESPLLESVAVSDPDRTGAASGSKPAR